MTSRAASLRAVLKHGAALLVLAASPAPALAQGAAASAGVEEAVVTGIRHSIEDAIQNNLQKILTLPNETVICPGHGPMTTVGEEKQHNPFFAGRI